MGFDIEFKGLDEMLEALDDVGINSDKRVRNHMNKQGRDFIDTAKGNTPIGPDVKEESKRIVNNYQSLPLKKMGKGYHKEIKNKAPHHHLANNGHRQVTHDGKVVGFVPGQFYIEETVAEREEPFYSDTEIFLGELYKELLEE